MVDEPQSLPCEPSHIRWFMMRVISENITRMYCARIGTSMPSSFSMARQYACSLHIIEQ